VVVGVIVGVQVLVAVIVTVVVRAIIRHDDRVESERRWDGRRWVSVADEAAEWLQRR
jgi:hypothetical protein